MTLRTPTNSELIYLYDRGYIPALLQKEGVQIGENELIKLHGVEIEASTPRIIWTARSMSGQVIGVQTREIHEHKYRWYQAPKAQHLPIIYATEEDHQRLYDTGEMILTEGAFDRIALHRCFPEIAVYARLSKGAANQLATFIRRYVKKLWLVFDNDDPGRKASQTTEKQLSSHLDVRVLNMPAKDPSELFRRRGLHWTREHFRRQMESDF